MNPFLAALAPLLGQPGQSPQQTPGMASQMTASASSAPPQTLGDAVGSLFPELGGSNAPAQGQQAPAGVPAPAPAPARGLGLAALAPNGLIGGLQPAPAPRQQPAPEQQMLRQAVRNVESRGSGDYSALGPLTSSGDRAYGAYQVMGKNIGPWTKEVLGQRLSPKEFLASQEAQDAVFDRKFGEAAQRHGSVEDAASVWFTGQPRGKRDGATDALGTTGTDYVARFTNELNTLRGTGEWSQLTSETQARFPIVTGSQSGRQFTPDTSGVAPQVLDRFRTVQDTFGASVPIVSGYRDPSRNARAGGASRSRHMQGDALDLDVSNMPIEERKRLIRTASQAGFTGIGVYNNSLHIDTGSKRYWGPTHSKDSLPDWAKDVINEHMTSQARADTPAGGAAAARGGPTRAEGPAQGLPTSFTEMVTYRAQQARDAREAEAGGKRRKGGGSGASASQSQQSGMQQDGVVDYGEALLASARQRPRTQQTRRTAEDFRKMSAGAKVQVLAQIGRRARGV